MGLSGRQAEQLREAVHRFAAASSRSEQLTLIDTLVKDWAQTSSFHRTLEGYLNTAVQLVPPAGMTAEEYRTHIGVLEAFNGSGAAAKRAAGSAIRARHCGRRPSRTCELCGLCRRCRIPGALRR
jgi:hypothetical protein